MDVPIVGGGGGVEVLIAGGIHHQTHIAVVLPITAAQLAGGCIVGDTANVYPKVLVQAAHVGVALSIFTDDQLSEAFVVGLTGLGARTGQRI